MGFLFPLFLLAGLALVIPVLIHLFNLRRYKHVYFPNIRFLQSLQLSSKRMSRIQKKAILLSRLLFLAALVLGFSQPFIMQDSKAVQGEELHVLYLDNSPSMWVKAGQQTLFDQVKEKAKYLVEALPDQARFAVITNDRGGAGQLLSGTEAIREIAASGRSGKAADLESLLGKLHLMRPEQRDMNVYLFSDFQETSFRDEGLLKADRHVNFFCIPLAAGGQRNVFFDTVYLNSVQPGSQQPVNLIARVKSAGSGANPDRHVRLFVNGSLKGGFGLPGNGDSLYTDSLSFQPSGRVWERLELVVSEDVIGFDDTFRLALKTRAAFEVLVSGGAGANPYLQTAISGFPGFTWRSGDVPAPGIAGTHPANLLILQDLEQLSATAIEGLESWLQSGRNVLIFPGSRRDKSMLNRALAEFVPLTFGKADTGLQDVVKLESGHPLIYDMFDHIPENIALPVTKLHFPVAAGFAAAEQILMRFRDGSPFLAQYQVGKGKLFVCASPLGAEFSDFPVSYFFAPLLYKMAMPAGGGMVFATVSGGSEPLWISSRYFDERAVWHARRGAYAFIPPQRLSGAGVDIFMGEIADMPGFYQLHQEGNQDTFLVAVNGNPDESYLKPVIPAILSKRLAPAAVQWADADEATLSRLATGQSRFPLWKLAVGFALLAVMLETFLLLMPRKKPKPASADSIR